MTKWYYEYKNVHASLNCKFCSIYIVNISSHYQTELNHPQILFLIPNKTTSETNYIHIKPYTHHEQFKHSWSISNALKEIEQKRQPQPKC